MKLADLFLKFQFTKIFLIFSYIVCWASISTSFGDLVIFKFYFFQQDNHIDEFLNHNISFTQVINFLRHGSIYLCFFLLVFLFLISVKKLDIKNNLIIYIFIIYFLFQLPGFFYTDNSERNISFIVSSLTVILTIILIDYYLSTNEKKFLIFFSFSILFIIFILSFFPKLIQFLEGESSIYGGYIENSQFFVDKTSPRSSGLSRSCLILILLSSIIFGYYFNYQKTLIVLKIILLSVIFLFQSRTIMFLSIFVFFIFALMEDVFSKKSLLKNILFYICIPSVIFFLITNYGTNKYALKRTNIENQLLGLELTNEPKEVWKQKNVREIFPENFSSGRFNDWNSIIKKIEKNKILFGYGSQGDRYLINQSASNGLIYAYSSSGIIGSIFFIIFSVSVFFRSFKILRLSYNNNKVDHIYGLIILVLLARSILESGYAVFSIDLIMLLTAFIFINQPKFKMNK